ncbi:winged helix-turn-helix domain-containing protein [Halocatena marina]|uniref:Helix-turn-helix domain-containing protein n=1 Tax=Halocatena marina TaxID=2934937 RepID=A0ABD5YTY8_9EURY|nr:helix-turn-helix domain-containing protein [Halocatena marina]
MADDTAPPSLQTVLDALDDPECRALLQSLTETPKQSVAALADSCALPRTSTYRKVNRLVDAGLIRSTTKVREDGHHTTVYVVSFEGMFIGLDDDGFTINVAHVESADERLARFWDTMRDAR